MTKYPVKRSRAATPREAEAETTEVIRSANSFFSFRYSHMEISAVGDKAHVRARQTRFDNGKLTTETFEGDADRTVYDRMLSDAQRYFLDQTALLASSLAWLLPSLRDPRSDRD